MPRSRGGGAGRRPGFTVLLRLVGAGEEVVVETRWKERDGRPTIIEASHLSRAAAPEATDDGEPTTDPEGPEPSTV